MSRHNPIVLSDSDPDVFTMSFTDSESSEPRRRSRQRVRARPARQPQRRRQGTRAERALGIGRARPRRQPRVQRPNFTGDWKFDGPDVNNIIRKQTTGEQYFKVGPSTIMGAGNGIFAARRFRRGEVIGPYTGKVMTVPEANKIAKTMAGDKLVSCKLGGLQVAIDGSRALQSDNEQIRKFGKVLMPNARFNWPGSCLFMANDTRRAAGFHTNMRSHQNGFLRATTAIAVGTELFWDYEDDYWLTRDRVERGEPIDSVATEGEESEW